MENQANFRACKTIFPFHTWRLAHISEGVVGLAFFFFFVLVGLMEYTIFLCKIRYGDSSKHACCSSFSGICLAQGCLCVGLVRVFFTLYWLLLISALFLLFFPLLPTPVHYGSLLVIIMLNSYLTFPLFGGMDGLAPQKTKPSTVSLLLCFDIFDSHVIVGWVTLIWTWSNIWVFYWFAYSHC